MNKLHPCTCGNTRILMQVINPLAWSDILFYAECPKCGKKTLTHTEESGALNEWNLWNKEAESK